MDIFGLSKTQASLAEVHEEISQKGETSGTLTGKGKGRSRGKGKRRRLHGRGRIPSVSHRAPA
eukprot:8443737-Pyramimonas_sp.AAC.1